MQVWAIQNSTEVRADTYIGLLYGQLILWCSGSRISAVVLLLGELLLRVVTNNEAYDSLLLSLHRANDYIVPSCRRCSTVRLQR